MYSCPRDVLFLTENVLSVEAPVHYPYQELWYWSHDPVIVDNDFLSYSQTLSIPASMVWTGVHPGTGKRQAMRIESFVISRISLSRSGSIWKWDFIRWTLTSNDKAFCSEKLRFGNIFAVSYLMNNSWLKKSRNIQSAHIEVSTCDQHIEASPWPRCLYRAKEVKVGG